MTTLQRSVLLFVAPAVMFSQAPTARPEFEVAALKPSAPAVRGKINDLALRIDGAQLASTYLTLKDYLRVAWRVPEFQIDGPAWLASERFDLVARVPPGAGPQIPEMLQSLLQARFKLVTHWETRDLAALALVPARLGSKLKLSAPQIPSGDVPTVTEVGVGTGIAGDLGNGAVYTIDMAGSRLEARKYPLSGLCDLLSRFSGRPVVDATGMSGGYDITLQFQPEDFSTITNRWAVARGILISQGALQRLQNEGDMFAALSDALAPLGLALVERKMPVQILVVDQMEKAPTEN